MASVVASLQSKYGPETSKTCTNAASLLAEPERIVEVEWAPSTDSVFLVAIQVEALDRHRLLSDVTKALADERVAGGAR